MNRPMPLRVDNSSMDVLKIRCALLGPELDLTLIAARNGQETLHLLLRNPGQESLYPKALIPDLQMSRMHGFDLLSALFDDPRFQDLPIIMFSSGALESDIAEARWRGATECVQKSMEPLQFRETVRTMVQQWAQVPSANSH